MAPAVIVPAVTAVPSAVVPGIIPSPTTVPSAIVPGIKVPRIVEPRVVPSAVPCIVMIVRTIEPGIVPSAIVPGIHAPVDGGIVRIMPGIPRGSIPGLISRPGVPAIVIEIDGSGVLVLVEIYLGHFVIRDEQGVDFLSALHEDRRAFRFGHKKVSLFLRLGSDGDISCRCVRSIVDSVLIPL